MIYPAKRTVGKSKFANKIGEEISEECSLERDRGGSHIVQHPSIRENADDIIEQLDQEEQQITEEIQETRYQSKK